MNQTFQAKAAALGYAYQFRYALSVAIARYQEGSDWAIEIESADDLEVTGTSELHLMQLKHRGPAAELSNASSDLWKTLRVWASFLQEVSNPLQPCKFFLVTTGGVPFGSAAHFLLAKETRDPIKAAEILREVATTSQNKDNARAYQAFSTLGIERQTQLLDCVVVLPASPDISELDDQFRAAAVLIVGPAHVNPFLDRLEGWWFRRCLRQLTSSESAIQSTEFDAQLSELREQFRLDSLPIDYDVYDTSAVFDEYSDRRFVAQLRLIPINNKRISFAVRDYFRAFTQRSRWSRENLLLVDELDKYERRLTEEWELHFERMRDDLGDAATEEEMSRAAKQIYAWLEKDADIPIRSGFSEPCITRGSYHMLADETLVGWHPDFAARLMALLEPAAGAT